MTGPFDGEVAWPSFRSCLRFHDNAEVAVIDWLEHGDFGEPVTLCIELRTWGELNVWQELSEHQRQRFSHLATVILTESWHLLRTEGCDDRAPFLLSDSPQKGSVPRKTYHQPRPKHHFRCPSTSYQLDQLQHLPSPPRTIQKCFRLTIDPGRSYRFAPVIKCNFHASA